MERWWEQSPEPQDKPTGTHLFVCQHGLWGSPEDVSFLEQYLKHNGWLTLNARNNSARCTFDGADVCGDRLAEEVVSHVHRLATGGLRVTHISFASYSFGGLIARYAIGKLLASGFFAMVVPVNFLTIASPHLGCWEHPSSMSHLAYNNILPWTLSRTGRQLLLADRWLEPEGLPLLAAMARPDCTFHAALATFHKRVLLADIRGDRTVPYTTAAITAVNPYLPGSAAAAAPYMVPLRRPRLLPPQAEDSCSGCRCRSGCGCGCGGVNGQGNAFTSSPQDDDRDDEESEGAGDSEMDAFHNMVLGDGDDYSFAGIVGIVRSVGNLFGFGPLLSFGLNVTSTLFGSATGSDGGMSSGITHPQDCARISGAAGLGGATAQRGLAVRAPCCCRGCGCCDRSNHSGKLAPAMIPLSISSSYPCIVRPHPAPAAARVAFSASGPGASSGSSSSGHRPLTKDAESSSMHRSASAPLPQRYSSVASSYGDWSGCSSGGSPGGSHRKPFQGPSNGVRVAANAVGKVAAQGALPFSLKSYKAWFFQSGGLAAAVERRNASASNKYGTAVQRYYQPRQVLSNGLPRLSSTIPSASTYKSSSEMSSFRASTGVSTGSCRFGTGVNSGIGSSDDVLASRVRMGLFVALLPVLLSLWLCMVAWLAAIWIHHYAVLLTVRPDRSWDVRLRRHEPAGPDTGETEAATPRSGGGDRGAETSRPPESEAPANGNRGDFDSADHEAPYDSCELFPGSELRMSLTEVGPPPLPASPLLLHRRMSSCICATTTPGMSCGADTAGPEFETCSGTQVMEILNKKMTIDVSSCAPSQQVPNGEMNPASVHSDESSLRTAPLVTDEDDAYCRDLRLGHDCRQVMVFGIPASDIPAHGPHSASATEAVSTAGPSAPTAAFALAPEPAPELHPVLTSFHCMNNETPSLSVGVVRGSVTAPKTAAPEAYVRPADAGTEVNAVSLLVRSAIQSVIRQHDGGHAPLSQPACMPSAVDKELKIAQAAESVVEAPERIVQELTRSIFRAVALCHVANSPYAGGELSKDNPTSPKTGTCAFSMRLPAVAGGSSGASVATASGTTASAPFPTSTSSLSTSSTASSSTAPASFSTPVAQLKEYPRSPAVTCQKSLDHLLSLQQGQQQVSGQQFSNGPGLVSREAVITSLASGDGTLAVMPDSEAPPARTVDQREPNGPRRHELEQQKGKVSCMRSSSLERRHDPAVLLAEMIANLNQLVWQKVDVDTRHYHAHAAIVVRSSSRFRSHMHIIDYAVRQLEL